MKRQGKTRRQLRVTVPNSTGERNRVAGESRKLEDRGSAKRKLQQAPRPTCRRTGTLWYEHPSCKRIGAPGGSAGQREPGDDGDSAGGHGAKNRQEPGRRGR